MLVGSIALLHTACTISYIKPAFVLKERKVCVQSTVEAPYLYLLARSASSVKDQILYVPTRLEDIQELEQNLTIHCYLKTLISSKNKPSNTINLNRRVDLEISDVNPNNAVRFQGFSKPSYHAVYRTMLRLCRIM